MVELANMTDREILIGQDIKITNICTGISDLKGVMNSADAQNRLDHGELFAKHDKLTAEASTKIVMNRLITLGIIIMMAVVGYIGFTRNMAVRNEICIEQMQLNIQRKHMFRLNKPGL
jgi:hypothetical protein